MPARIEAGAGQEWRRQLGGAEGGAMTTGEKLRWLRTQLGISQITLAYRARLSPPTVWAIEHDKRPATVTARRLLSAALTLFSGQLIRPDDLLGDPPEVEGQAGAIRGVGVACAVPAAAADRRQGAAS
jgi:transcriptional regulator with XRE-family HTH domain